MTTETVSGSDGTFANIQKLNVTVSGADAELEIAGLNVDKTGKWMLGTKKVDTDGDGSLEEVDHMEVKTPGTIQVYDLGTLGDTFSKADIRGLSIDVVQTPSDLPSDRVRLTTEETGNQYPGYHGTATFEHRMGFASAYDLSYANTDFEGTQSVTSDRIIAVKISESVSLDTDWSNVESYTDKTDLYSSKVTNVTLDNTVQAGTFTDVKIEDREGEIVFTSEEMAIDDWAVEWRNQKRRLSVETEEHVCPYDNVGCVFDDLCFQCKMDAVQDSF